MCSNVDQITNVQIFRSEGVGPNGFRFSLKVSNSELIEVLEADNTSLVFSKPLDKLSGSNFSIARIEKNEYDINIPSMLFIEKSAGELESIAVKLKGKLTITIQDNLSNEWVLKYP